MAGYYWRVVDAEAGSVIMVFCGVCRGAGESWAAVALAAHPGGLTRHALVAPAAAEPSCFGAVAGDILRGSADGLAACGLEANPRRPSALMGGGFWPPEDFGTLVAVRLVPPRRTGGDLLRAALREGAEKRGSARAEPRARVSAERPVRVMGRARVPQAPGRAQKSPPPPESPPPKSPKSPRAGSSAPP
jgi:hypothetical protein